MTDEAPSTSDIPPGRYTARPRQPLALFLIGMRIHKPLKVRTWWPAFTAMTRMLRQLESDPDLGLLAATLSYTPHPLLIQYWRSPDHLDRFARDPTLSHRPAWKTFNQLTATTTDVVGLWHEIYEVTPDTTRSLYRNMPRIGLARAFADLDLEDTPRIPRRQGCAMDLTGRTGGRDRRLATRAPTGPALTTSHETETTT